MVVMWLDGAPGRSPVLISSGIGTRKCRTPGAATNLVPGFQAYQANMEDLRPERFNAHQTDPGGTAGATEATGVPMRPQERRRRQDGCRLVR